MKWNMKTGKGMIEAAQAAFSDAPADSFSDKSGNSGNKTFSQSLFAHSGKDFYLSAEDKAVWAQVARTILPLRQDTGEQTIKAGQRRQARRIAGQAAVTAQVSENAQAEPAAESRAQAMISAIERGDLDLLSALVSAEKKARKAAAKAQSGKPAAKFESIAAMLSANPHISPDASVSAAEQTGRPAAFDRGAYRKLARGQMPIEGRLDLHGHTQDEAHYALLYFIRSAQAQGRRHLLVITGKGHSLGSEGILQKLVPHWLAAPQLRIYIAAVEQAARAHGGSGAFYIRLRRG